MGGILKMAKRVVVMQSEFEMRPLCDWKMLSDSARDILDGNCSGFQIARMQYLLKSSQVPIHYRKAIELHIDVAKGISKRGLGGSYFISGQSRKGKTHSMCGIIHQLAAHHVAARIDFNALFISTPVLLSKLRGSFDTGKGNPLLGPSEKETEQQIIQNLTEVTYLFIDDLGSEKASEYSQSVFYSIINQRFEKDMHLTINSNLPMSRIGIQIGKRCASRINEICQVITINNKKER